MKHPQSMPLAVVLCLTATGLTVIRSLGKHGIPVFGIDGNKFQIGHYSRYLKKRRVLSCHHEQERLLDALISYAKEESAKPVLIAAGDDELLFVSEFADSLRQHFIMPNSYNMHFSGLMLDKIAFYKACMKLGVDLPGTFFPEDHADVRSISNQLRYPAIIKPGYGHAWRERFKGKKVLEIANSTELQRTFEEHALNPKEMVIQEVVPGKEDNITVFGGYFNRESEPLSVFTATKSRQYPPMFGTASLCQTRWYPEVAEMSMDLVNKMGYHGICGTEYKWDPRDSKWKLMEINFRPTLWFAITRASGVDIVYDAYLDLLGLPVDKKIGTQKDGVLWQYLVRDIISMVHYIKKKEVDMKTLGQFLYYKKEYAILSLKDWKVSLFYPIYVFDEYRRHM